MELELEREQVQVREKEVEQVQVQEIELAKQLKYGNRILRVYVNLEEDKYYIDVMAAYALNMISYEEAASLSDKNFRLFEISKKTLETLKKEFGGNIHYHYLDVARIIPGSDNISYYENQYENKFDDNHKDKDYFNQYDNLNIIDEIDKINNKKL